MRGSIGETKAKINRQEIAFKDSTQALIRVIRGEDFSVCKK
jgi:hypothetical protein